MLPLLIFVVSFYCSSFLYGSDFIQGNRTGFISEITSNLYIFDRHLTGKSGLPKTDTVIAYIPPNGSRKLFEIVSVDEAARYSKLYGKKSRGMFSAAIWAQYIIPLWRNEIRETTQLIEMISTMVNLDRLAYAPFFNNIWAVERVFSWFDRNNQRLNKADHLYKIQTFLNGLGVDYKRCNSFHPHNKSDISKILYDEKQMQALLRTAQHWGYDVQQLAKLTSDRFEASKQVVQGRVPQFLSTHVPMDAVDVNFVAHWSVECFAKVGHPSSQLLRSLWLEGRLHRNPQPAWNSNFRIEKKGILSALFGKITEKKPKKKIGEFDNYTSSFQTVGNVPSQYNNKLNSDINNALNKRPREFTPLSSDGNWTEYCTDDGSKMKKRKLDGSFSSTDVTAAVSDGYMGELNNTTKGFMQPDQHFIEPSHYATGVTEDQPEIKSPKHLENISRFDYSTSHSIEPKKRTLLQFETAHLENIRSLTVADETLIEESRTHCLADPDFCEFLIRSLSTLN